MKKITLVDGKRNAFISVFNRLCQFGDGVFETLVFKNNNILFWQYHIKRLNQGCDRLAIASINESLWLKDIAKAMRKISLKTGVIKLVVSRGHSGRGYAINEHAKPVRIVHILPLPKRKKITHLDICKTRYGNNERLSGIKHCNRLEQVLASHEVAEDGLMLDQQDNVISTTKANLFIVKKNELITPSLRYCGIAGTRRAIVLEIAEKFEILTQIKPISIEDVLESDAVFITSSLLGIAIIKQIGPYELDQPPSSIVKAIGKEFVNLAQSNSKRFTVRKWRYLYGYGLIAILFVLVGNIVLFANEKINAKQSDIFHLKKTMLLSDIAEQLKTDNHISSSFKFILLAKIFTNDRQLKAGYYQLQGMTVRQLLHHIASGKVARHTTTLLEGQTLTAYYQQLIQHPGVIVDGSLEQVLKKAKMPPKSEGLLFPDSYYFRHNTKVSDLFIRAHKKMEKTLRQLWAKRQHGLPFKNVYQALILASLIEKETANDEEKAEIAGVFVRRLKKSMYLQTDPSVIYALGERFKPPLKQRHLKVKSAYNTYLNKGLPPTPISAAGLASIYAALHPKEGETLFFVSKKNGSHHFSKTYKEHRQAIKKYLK